MSVKAASANRPSASNVIRASAVQPGRTSAAGEDLWQKYMQHLTRVPLLGLTLDISRMRFDEQFMHSMEASMHRAFDAMAALEKGAIANPDEKRMVGHYWLRKPELAPDAHIAAQIQKGIEDIKEFAGYVHSGVVHPPTSTKFSQFVVVGIGGSALGPMFVAGALGDGATDRMRVYFIDNTDPDGIDRVLKSLAGKLNETLCIVTSKSGGTPETHNGMILLSEAYTAAGLEFAQHAVAITMPGSSLDHLAKNAPWVARFAMFDWVGGRTSELSAVGLLPAALQGLDIDGLIEGAAACDEATRRRDLRQNPAAVLALMWYHATGGKAQKDMVVLPYKDRLLLFSRYLQQLVMESIGKGLDLEGRQVNQGLSVYGNKGSTDQHAYVQQLREGVPNFFVVFIRVLESGGSAAEVGPGITAGDHLHGLLLGTRQALFEAGRESITITIPRVDSRTIGGLIALFERAVGLYASLLGVNAYHQPGVEAGKKAAASFLELQKRALTALLSSPQSAEQIATTIGAPDSVESVYQLLEHLAANDRANMDSSGAPREAKFSTVTKKLTVEFYEPA